MGQGTKIFLKQFLKRAALAAKRNFHNSIFTTKTIRVFNIPDKSLYSVSLFHGGVYFDIADVNQVLDVNCLNIFLAYKVSLLLIHISSICIFNTIYAC